MRGRGSARALQPTRHARNERMLIAGMSERFAVKDCSDGIAALWRRFAPCVGNLVGQVGDAAYGVRYDTEQPGEMEYLCAVEVANFSSVPRNFTLMCIPAQRCAVFLHRGSVASVRTTWDGIHDSWLPGSGQICVGTPFERYGPSFDPHAGTGGVEVWIPVAPRNRADELAASLTRHRFASEGLGA
ncbi:GyrI-like domain-containing protein [Povalibacter sp.]|uniref:GyrI-like domain-containing protein n=1 Tax=Povalibacter sp. TaxID=1962978 RepID=UPI002F4008BE